MRFLLWTLSFLAVSNALAVGPNAPRVKITDGTVIGSTNDSVDTFLGIPYADPPIGNLRFKPPRPLSSPLGIFNAASTPAGCPQHVLLTDPEIFNQLPETIRAGLQDFFVQPPIVSEDCLNLAIQRPSSIKPKDKIPVLVWIYGGGFERGFYNKYDYFSSLVTQSVSMGHPILVVRIQYRVGAWGFLSGKELQKDRSTNIGLKDQRQALKWIAQNIAAFGGDPDRVTIWGQSAGSMSVFDQMIANDGDNTYRGRKLFRGAIMNSGSSSQADTVDSPLAQHNYDSLVAAVGCNKAAGDTLACLRHVPYETLYNATSVIPGLFSPQGPRLNFVPRPDPHDTFYSTSPIKSLQQKRIAPVPVLSGTQDDDGSLFGLPMLNSTNSSTLVDGLRGLLPSTSKCILKAILKLYPDDPTLGCPFETGESNQLYPGFKRNSAILGDLFFHHPKRAFHQAVADRINIWAFNAKYGKDFPFLGTYHSSDLGVIHTGKPIVPYEAIIQYYISFVNFLDPNALGHLPNSKKIPNWPKWEKQGRRMMEFRDNTTMVVKDDARQEAFEHFVRVQSDLAL